MSCIMTSRIAMLLAVPGHAVHMKKDQVLHGHNQMTQEEKYAVEEVEMFRNANVLGESLLNNQNRHLASRLLENLFKTKVFESQVSDDTLSKQFLMLDSSNKLLLTPEQTSKHHFAVIPVTPEEDTPAHKVRTLKCRVELSPLALTMLSKSEAVNMMSDAFQQSKLSLEDFNKFAEGTLPQIDSEFSNAVEKLHDLLFTVEGQQAIDAKTKDCVNPIACAEAVWLGAGL